MGTFFLRASMRAQKKTLNLSAMVHPPYEDGPGYVFVIHPSQIHHDVSCYP